MPERPCAFHPDRFTAVSCARCDRPICPEDMIDAPVGVQCPVCAGRMREGAMGAATYRARTRLERTTVARRYGRFTMTSVIVAVCVAVFVLMLGRSDAQTLYDFGALVAPLPRSMWWRVFTSMFVHIGLMHLLFNMYALWLFGPALEARYGRARMLALFLVSGLLGAGVSLLMLPGGVRAGASGGVFGILGGWIAFFARHRSLRGAREQLRSLLGLVAINLVIGFIPGFGIDVWAHIGGLVGGIVVGAGLELAGAMPAGPRRSLVTTGAYLAPVVAAIVLIVPNTVAL